MISQHGRSGCWVFDAFAGASLRQIMLVHDAGNPASCRVAEKAGIPGAQPGESAALVHRRAHPYAAGRLTRAGGRRSASHDVNDPARHHNQPIHRQPGL
jgi:hypothetical protein